MSCFVCSEHHFRVLSTAIVFAEVDYRWNGATREVFSTGATSEPFDHVARLLMAENIKSYEDRYPKEKRQKVDFSTVSLFGSPDGKPVAINRLDLTGVVATSAVWTLEPVRCPNVCDVIGVMVKRTRSNGRKFNALELYKLIQCYRYQANEHKGWLDSEACAMTAAAMIYYAQIYIVRDNAKAYDKAEWSIDE